MNDGRTIELGLIGSGIDRSLAPLLHETLGRLTGRPTTYRRHDRPATFAAELPRLLAELAAGGVTGVNVTHPFEEAVVPLVAVDDATAAIGAVNTIRFDPDGWRGWNTDHSGFVQAYRRRFGDADPGVVVSAVGNAVSYAPGC